MARAHHNSERDRVAQILEANEGEYVRLLRELKAFPLSHQGNGHLATAIDIAQKHVHLAHHMRVRIPRALLEIDRHTLQVWGRIALDPSSSRGEEQGLCTHVYVGQRHADVGSFYSVVMDRKVLPDLKGFDLQIEATRDKDKNARYRAYWRRINDEFEEAKPYSFHLMRRDDRAQGLLKLLEQVLGGSWTELPDFSREIVSYARDLRDLVIRRELVEIQLDEIAGLSLAGALDAADQGEKADVEAADVPVWGVDIESDQSRKVELPQKDAVLSRLTKPIWEAALVEVPKVAGSHQFLHDGVTYRADVEEDSNGGLRYVIAGGGFVPFQQTYEPPEALMQEAVATYEGYIAEGGSVDDLPAAADVATNRDDDGLMLAVDYKHMGDGWWRQILAFKGHDRLQLRVQTVEADKVPEGTLAAHIEEVAQADLPEAELQANPELRDANLASKVVQFGSKED